MMCRNWQVVRPIFFVILLIILFWDIMWSVSFFHPFSKTGQVIASPREINLLALSEEALSQPYLQQVQFEKTKSGLNINDLRLI